MGLAIGLVGAVGAAVEGLTNWRISSNVKHLKGEINKSNEVAGNAMKGVAQETTDRNAAIGALRTDITTETNDRIAAETALAAAIAAGDNAITTNFTTADATITTNFTTADAAITTNFTAADAAITTAYTAADAAITTAYTAADAVIRTDFTAADAAITTAYTAADAVIRTDFTAADAVIRTDFNAADAAIRTDFTAADAANAAAIRAERADRIADVQAEERARAAGVARNAAGIAANAANINALQYELDNEKNDRAEAFREVMNGLQAGERALKAQGEEFEGFVLKNVKEVEQSYLQGDAALKDELSELRALLNTESHRREAEDDDLTRAITSVGTRLATLRNDFDMDSQINAARHRNLQTELSLHTSNLRTLQADSHEFFLGIASIEAKRVRSAGDALDRELTSQLEALHESHRHTLLTGSTFFALSSNMNRNQQSQSFRWSEQDKKDRAMQRQLAQVTAALELLTGENPRLQGLVLQGQPNAPTSAPVRAPDPRINLSRVSCPASPIDPYGARPYNAPPRVPAPRSIPASPIALSPNSSSSSSSSASASSLSTSTVCLSAPVSGSAPGGPAFPPPPATPDLADLAKLAKEDAKKAIEAKKPQIKPLNPETAKEFKDKFMRRKNRGADEETLAEEFGEYKKVLNEYVKGLEASKEAIKAKNPDDPRILRMVVEAGELDDIIEIITQGLKKLKRDYQED